MPIRKGGDESDDDAPMPARRDSKGRARSALDSDPESSQESGSESAPLSRPDQDSGSSSEEDNPDVLEALTEDQKAECSGSFLHQPSEGTALVAQVQKHFFNGGFSRQSAVFMYDRNNKPVQCTDVVDGTTAKRNTTKKAKTDKKDIPAALRVLDVPTPIETISRAVHDDNPAMFDLYRYIHNGKMVVAVMMYECFFPSRNPYSLPIHIHGECGCTLYFCTEQEPLRIHPSACLLANRYLDTIVIPCARRNVEADLANLRTQNKGMNNQGIVKLYYEKKGVFFAHSHVTLKDILADMKRTDCPPIPETRNNNGKFRYSRNEQEDKVEAFVDYLCTIDPSELMVSSFEVLRSINGIRLADNDDIQIYGLHMYPLKEDIDNLRLPFALLCVAEMIRDTVHKNKDIKDPVRLAVLMGTVTPFFLEERDTGFGIYTEYKLNTIAPMESNDDVYEFNGLYNSIQDEVYTFINTLNDLSDETKLPDDDYIMNFLEEHGSANCWLKAIVLLRGYIGRRRPIYDKVVMQLQDNLHTHNPHIAKELEDVLEELKANPVFSYKKGPVDLYEKAGALLLSTDGGFTAKFGDRL